MINKSVLYQDFPEESCLYHLGWGGGGVSNKAKIPSDFSSDKLLDSPSNWPCKIVNTGFSFSNQAAGEFPFAGEDNFCAQGVFECQRQQGIA